MKNLSIILILKIGITIFFWCIPLLFFPISFLREGSFLNRPMGFPDLAPVAVFIKLLGMAYGALLVGYMYGLIATWKGRYPASTVWTGIVSNGGAFLLLCAYRESWSSWKGWAPGFMWASLGATGLITAGLIAFGFCGRHLARER